MVFCQILIGSRLRFYLPPAKILVLRNEVLCDGGRLGKWQVSVDDFIKIVDDAIASNVK